MNKAVNFAMIVMLSTIAVSRLSFSANEPVGARASGTTSAKPTMAAPVVMPVTTPNRSVYLNGVDISSARNQDLRNVHIKISDNGDVFIAAPQYQVTEEETFMPLSSYTGKSAPPEHKPPQAMNSGSGAKSANAAQENTPVEKPSAITPDITTPATSAPAQPASPNAPKTVK